MTELEDTLRGDTLRGDTLRGDTLRGDTLRGDTCYVGTLAPVSTHQRFS